MVRGGLPEVVTLSREGKGECSKRKRTEKDLHLEVRVCQVNLRNCKKAFVAGKEMRISR